MSCYLRAPLMGYDIHLVPDGVPSNIEALFEMCALSKITELSERQKPVAQTLLLSWKTSSLLLACIAVIGLLVMCTVNVMDVLTLLHTDWKRKKLHMPKVTPKERLEEVQIHLPIPPRSSSR